MRTNLCVAGEVALASWAHSSSKPEFCAPFSVRIAAQSKRTLSMRPYYIRRRAPVDGYGYRGQPGRRRSRDLAYSPSNRVHGALVDAANTAFVLATADCRRLGMPGDRTDYSDPRSDGKTLDSGSDRKVPSFDAGGDEPLSTAGWLRSNGHRRHPRSCWSRRTGKT